MTDFNSFDPNKKIKGASFNSNSQGKGKSEEAPETQDQGPAVDPYANLKLDPNKLMKLLSAQAQLNVPSEVANAGINRAMDNFATNFSPERHERLSRIIENAYTQEFGKAPSAEVLQELLDDYVIGQPVVQGS